MNTAAPLSVPYADVELEPVRELLGVIHQTKTSIASSASSINEHWNTLSQSMAGSSVETLTFASTITGRTSGADDLVSTLQGVWNALDTYADDAKTPLDNLKRLRDEAATLQSQRPRDVIVAPGTAQRDIWAAQAGISNGALLAESPFATWNRQRDALEAEIATWVQSYENAASTCVSALRRIRNPWSMGLWDHFTGGDGPAGHTIFNRDGMTWHRGPGENDGYRAITDRNVTYNEDGTVDRTDNLASPASSEDSSASSPQTAAGDESAQTSDESTSATSENTEETAEASDGNDDSSLRPSVGVAGINKSGSWTLGAEGKSSREFGQDSGFHGAGSASYRAGLMADATAGVNIEDGNLVASAAAGAAVGATAAVDGSIGYGVANIGGQASATVGASANAEAGASVGRDGVSAQAGVSAMVGGQAEASAELGLSGVTAGGGVSGYAGAGIHANVDAALTLDRVAVDVSVGAALGLGAGVELSVDIDPKELYSDVKSALDPRGWF